MYCPWYADEKEENGEMLKDTHITGLGGKNSPSALRSPQETPLKQKSPPNGGLPCK